MKRGVTMCRLRIKPAVLSSIALMFMMQLSSCSHLPEIEIGAYVSVGESPSTLLLQGNNEFALIANEYVSLIPRGQYTINNNKLHLVIADDEHIFIIGEDSLIFEQGTWLGHWVEQGSVFKLSPNNQ